jgi:hypothetical protein
MGAARTVADDDVMKRPREAAMRRDDAGSLRALARRCRQAARGASTSDVETCLSQMAEGYDRQADKAEQMGAPPLPPGS